MNHSFDQDDLKIQRHLQKGAPPPPAPRNEYAQILQRIEAEMASPKKVSWPWSFALPLAAAAAIAGFFLLRSQSPRTAPGPEEIAAGYSLFLPETANEHELRSPSDDWIVLGEMVSSENSHFSP